MAGTNHSIKGDFPENMPKGPVIVLVESQLGENIGTAARAMLNCGVTELRLVNPRDGWPNGKAVAASSGASHVIDNVKVYNTTAEAVEDMEFVLATTARHRDMIKTVYNLKGATKEIHKRNANDKTRQKCAILFGPERSGLTNEDVALANGLLNIPLNPGFSSLNLAQAVLLICYSWVSTLEDKAEIEQELHTGDTQPASQKQINHLLKHLEDELDAKEFFKTPKMKPTTMRNITSMFVRMEMTEQETQTFHGIISALSGKKSWK